MLEMSYGSLRLPQRAYRRSSQVPLAPAPQPPLGTSVDAYGANEGNLWTKDGSCQKDAAVIECAAIHIRSIFLWH